MSGDSYIFVSRTGFYVTFIGRTLCSFIYLTTSHSLSAHKLIFFIRFCLVLLPRCMQCRRGLAMTILSVRLSVTRVDCDKTEERSVQIYIPYERTFILVF